MGTNRRYADKIDRQMSDRIVQVVARGGDLQTLTATELRLSHVPLTIDPKPRRKVSAWVRFGKTPVHVDAVAARWTDDAVGIIFEIDGKEYRCWVWSGAVTEKQ